MFRIFSYSDPCFIIIEVALAARMRLLKHTAKAIPPSTPLPSSPLPREGVGGGLLRGQGTFGEGRVALALHPLIVSFLGLFSFSRSFPVIFRWIWGILPGRSGPRPYKYIQTGRRNAIRNFLLHLQNG